MLARGGDVAAVHGCGAGADVLVKVGDWAWAVRTGAAAVAAERTDR